jgi:hypothetical protein
MPGGTEQELHEAALLVAEITSARVKGDRETNRGNADEDLLAAVEALEHAVIDWKRGKW